MADKIETRKVVNESRISKPSWIASRYRVVLLMCWGNIALNVLQLNFNLTIVAMVDQTAVERSAISSDECVPESRLHQNSTQPEDRPKGEFDWSPYTQGMLLGAIFYGYIGSHAIGGYLAEIFGGKWVVFGGISVPSCLALLIPLAARTGVPYLFALRLIQGLAAGVMVPVFYVMLAAWAPVQERSVMFALLYFGNVFGSASAVIFSGLISSAPKLGWPWVFYGSGLFGAVFSLVWAKWGHSSPKHHPGMTTEEKFYIQQSFNEGPVLKQRSSKTPWGQMLRSGPFWSLIFVRSCYGWGVHTDQTAVPIYLQTVFEVPVNENGFLNGVMYSVCALSSAIGGLLADFLRRRTTFGITSIRKGFSVAAYSGAIISWLAITWSGCNSSAASVFIVLSKFFLSLSVAGDYVALVEMAPQYAGTISGIVYTVADSTGFFSPMVTGAIINENVTFDQWCYVFYCASAIVFVGMLSFVIFGSAEVQPWAKEEDEPLLSDKRPVTSLSNGHGVYRSTSTS